jgi:peroxiredoxin
MRTQARFAQLAAGAAVAVTLAAGALWLGPARAQDSARPKALLPRFAGHTFDGGHAGSDAFDKRRGMVLVFSDKDPDADRTAALVASVLKGSEKANLAVLGVTRDTDPVLIRHFVKLHGFEFPVIVDSDGQVSSLLHAPPGTSTLILVDSQGGIQGQMSGLATQDPSLDSAYGVQLRRILDLAPEDNAATPIFGVLPPAPPFAVTTTDGKSTVRLADYSGKVLVFIFFLPTCPHCHAMLKYLNGLSAQLASKDLAIVPVSISDKKYVVDEMVHDLQLSFPAYLDLDRKAQNAYGSLGEVPEVFVIDRKGKVVQRTAGDSPRLEALVTMAIRHELGGPNPILLDKTGYSGEEFCSVCHQSEHATWLLTGHSNAWDTLVAHGSDRDPACLKCHTVGFGQAGGFDPQQRQDWLRGVQCETCHGRGGPHQSPDFAKAGLEPVCLGCHDAEHSLHFVFSERLPLISHAANAQALANLSVEDRRKLAEKRSRRDRQLFEKSDYVGSAACQSCHQKEHKLWSESAHARAFSTLEQRHEAQNPDCQRCHTTGFKQPTGFPAGGTTLVGVGCESCHGPGKRHVEDQGKTSGTILALTDKCDTCAIQLICGTCHDDANDKGFEFQIESKLAKIKHGFREKKTAAK